ncbi:VOC family protein [Halorarum halobium]|uniref:VOC family protein n=1 Tax=Halorarum halobium TaxID=3075121 RepID=UPI0028AAEE9D|nr:VOC family protein [Halobaculum sp. XH14]
MITQIGRTTVLVEEYEEALAFYTGTLGFDVIADVELDGGFRALHVGPAGESGSGLWLMEATGEEERALIGNQTGSQPAFVLYTDEIRETYETLAERGVEFSGEPEAGPSGSNVHFEDPYGNRIVLAELHEPRD